MVGHTPRYRSSRLQKKQIVTEQRSVLIAGEASDRKAFWMITFDVSAMKRNFIAVLIVEKASEGKAVWLLTSLVSTME